MQIELTLPPEVSIYTVTQLRTEWLAGLNGDEPDAAAGNPCRVDAAAVGEIDAAGVQLLVSLGNELARNRRVLQLVNPSAALSGACIALGAASLLDSPSAARSAQ